MIKMKISVCFVSKGFFFHVSPTVLCSSAFPILQSIFLSHILVLLDLTFSCYLMSFVFSDFIICYKVHLCLQHLSSVVIFLLVYVHSFIYLALFES